jgi:hypothetical protein
MKQLAPLTAPYAPAVVTASGPRASYRFLEFFTAKLRLAALRRLFDWMVIGQTGVTVYLKNGGTLERAAQDGEPCQHPNDAALRPPRLGSDARRGGEDFGLKSHHQHRGGASSTNGVYGLEPPSWLKRAERLLSRRRPPRPTANGISCPATPSNLRLARGPQTDGLADLMGT